MHPLRGKPIQPIHAYSFICFTFGNKGSLGLLRSDITTPDSICNITSGKTRRDSSCTPASNSTRAGRISRSRMWGLGLGMRYFHIDSSFVKNIPLCLFLLSASIISRVAVISFPSFPSFQYTHPPTPSPHKFSILKDPSLKSHPAASGSSTSRARCRPRRNWTASTSTSPTARPRNGCRRT